jgi:hypothetical protein
MRNEWSLEEDDRLRSLARSGLSLAEIIAHEIHRSKSSVRTRAMKLTIAVARDRNSHETPVRHRRRKLLEAKE